MLQILLNIVKLYVVCVFIKFDYICICDENYPDNYDLFIANKTVHMSNQESFLVDVLWLFLLIMVIHFNICAI